MNELILVVDDDPKITRLARDYLEKNGMRVLTAGDGLSALAVTRREKPDLLVLDLLLPKMDGWEVCRLVRRESDVPIIMLTARAEESDQVAGLELGADEYVIKPFSPAALVARVRALLRRSQGRLAASPILRFARLEIEPTAHRVLLDGQELHLTPSEFKLLVVLAENAGQTLTRQQLLDHLYGGTASAFDRSVDSHIKNIRRKLETDPTRPHFIETVYGVGYRFIPGRQE
jgi:DNA-binding response OmpR family regulator